MLSIADLEAALIDLARQTMSANPSSRLPAELRQTFAQTLAEYRADQKAHGGTGSEPFFDLVMFDANPVDEALFIVAFFRPASVKFYAGRSVPHAVIALVSQFASRDVDEMEAAIRQHPGVTLEPLDIARPLAEHWLS